MTSAAVVGIDPERAALLARTAARVADDLQVMLNRLRVDLEGQCTGVPSLLGPAAQWLRESSEDVVRRAAAARDERVFGLIGPLAAPLPYSDALLGFLSAGNPLAVRLMVAGLSKGQLVSLARAVLRELAGASLSDDERLMYRRALLPLAARLLMFATGPATAVYIGGAGAGDAARELRRLMDVVGRLMLPPPHREGSGWEAFFRGLFLGDFDRGYTTPSLESARVSGLLLGSLNPGADVRDAGAAALRRDPASFVLCALAAYPVYGDALRIVSKTLSTGLHLTKAARRVQDLAVAASRLTKPLAPASAAASNSSRVRAVDASRDRVLGAAAGPPAAPGSLNTIGLDALGPSVRAGLRQVALGRVVGFPVAAGDIAALPPKPAGHFIRYELADGSSAVTGEDAELYVSTDGGRTWSFVR